MMRTFLAPFLFVLALLATPAQAGDAAPAAANPQAEKRMQNLAAELRCLVCQNQSLADSNSELATDLRREILVQVESGASDREVVDFMVARYGDFVRYRPPFNAATLLLWVGPFVLLIVGLAALLRNLARRRALSQRELNEDERARAARLLDQAGGTAPTSDGKNQ